VHCHGRTFAEEGDKYSIYHLVACGRSALKKGCPHYLGNLDYDSHTTHGNPTHSWRKLISVYVLVEENKYFILLVVLVGIIIIQ
jgi:hypothetical protein